jgi:hypothetical protein
MISNAGKAGSVITVDPRSTHNAREEMRTSAPVYAGGNPVKFPREVSPAFLAKNGSILPPSLRAMLYLTLGFYVVSLQLRRDKSTANLLATMRHGSKECDSRE